MILGKISQALIATAIYTKWKHYFSEEARYTASSPSSSVISLTLHNKYWYMYIYSLTGSGLNFHSKFYPYDCVSCFSYCYKNIAHAIKALHVLLLTGSSAMVTTCSFLTGFRLSQEFIFLL